MPGPSDATPVVEAQKRASAELKAVADFLRGKNGPKIKRGVLNGKRVDYFKGRTALRTLQGPAYQKLKKVPEVKDEESAKAVMQKVLPNAFFLRVDRPNLDPPPASGVPRTLLLSPSQSLSEDSYYAWFYDGSPLYTILGGVAMVVIMLAGVMFPLWPIKLRLGVWYLSIGALMLIGLFIALAIVRLIIWCFTVLAMKKAIWIFPNLFEDVGFIDSFIPTWAYDEPKRKKKRVPGASSSTSSKATSGKPRMLKTPKNVKGSVAEGVSSDTPPADNGDTQGVTSALPESMQSDQGVEQAGGLRHRQQATVEEIDDDGI